MLSYIMYLYTFIVNLGSDLTTATFNLGLFTNNTNYQTVVATLMLQFGALVFILSIVCLAAPNYFGLYGGFILTSTPLFFMWIYSILTFIFIWNSSQLIFINGFKWFILPGIAEVHFDILLDKLSITYVTLVLSIGFCVIIYAFSYFRYEPHVERLLLFINLFMISMCILVMGGNVFVLFFGWELIGLTSFFLINFWSTKISTLKAAFKAFLFNKLSDLGILCFIIFSLLVMGDIQIPSLNNNFINFINYKINCLGLNISYLELLSFFLMLSAFVKSAQFGFHIWLPDSMEAPVPASALIHSATLVSAGVFLFLRFSFLFELVTLIKYWIIIISSITAAFGGVCACFQSDVKRILAYSTISHCGFLVFLSCSNNLELTLLYLCIHGFFKAIVFMCIGNVIRFARNYQDFRFMGGFSKYLPFETTVTFIGLINLAGLPFSFGFFIKHFTLITLFDVNNIFIKINLLIGVFSGLVYSYRVYYYIFFDIKKAKKAIYYSASKKHTRSILYSNTTLASCAAISLLLIITTFITILAYYYTFKTPTTFTTATNWSSTNKTLFLLENRLVIVNNLSFYINWFILILGVILVTLKLRYQVFYFHFVNKINTMFLFFFFMFIILSIIC